MVIVVLVVLPLHPIKRSPPLVHPIFKSSWRQKISQRIFELPNPTPPTAAQLAPSLAPDWSAARD